MTDSPLHVAFLWHMHQPFYKDPFTGVYRMPWVRLHGTKDYLDMVSILDDYPQIRQTVNLVPSLLEQILDYTEKGATDFYLEATRKRAGDLTGEDKVFLLEKFFLANWDTMIKPIPRYHELLAKRGYQFTRQDLERSARYFSTQDFLDLQVLFNLTWIDPFFRRNDPFLSGLLAKGRDFTEEEKGLLLERQFSILGKIIPKYRELSDQGRIEISTSPFYHPILPLLWDTDTAREPSPDIRLPKRRFAHPEDARRQIGDAADFYEKLFGKRPAGMWPSEGSVSHAVVKAIGEEGIRWIATDEDILAGSLGQGLRTSSGGLYDPSLLYSAYEHAGVSMLFRDHKISDLLGFVYSGWDPSVAAGDLIDRLHRIQESLPPGGPFVVPIILDGENAWEYYRNDGEDFFRHLYDGLSRSQRLRTTTISDFLSECSPRRLDHLKAGSWIYANFHVWLGHEEDNTSWDYLGEARDQLDAVRKAEPDRDLTAAWKALSVAEGSDWNWWYGDDHSTELAEEFDELYRLNLMKVYREIGREVPPHLSVPVLREDRSVAPAVEIRGFIHPRIDGLMTSYFEWYQGASLDVGKSGGSMHMTESLVSRIYYGFNKEMLFVRGDPRKALTDFAEDTDVIIQLAKPGAYRLIFPLDGRGRPRLLSLQSDAWVEVATGAECAVREIFECALPFADVKAAIGEEIAFSLTLQRKGDEIERCPWRGSISVTVPSPDFEAMMWC